MSGRRRARGGVSYQTWYSDLPPFSLFFAAGGDRAIVGDFGPHGRRWDHRRRRQQGRDRGFRRLLQTRPAAPHRLSVPASDRRRRERLTPVHRELVQGGEVRPDPAVLSGWPGRRIHALPVQLLRAAAGAQALPRLRRHRTYYGLAFGAGASVTLSGRFFLRPEIQLKMLGPGPFIIVLPALGAGFRF